MLYSNKKSGKKTSTKDLKIALASDHGGFRLKETIKNILQCKNYKVLDFGTHNIKSCDYPKYGIKLVKSILNQKAGRGILVCRSGIGYSILANRFSRIRAALCYNARAARLSRQHNDSNVLILAGDFIKNKDIKRILDVWLNTEFIGGRHARRLRQVEKFSS